MRRLGELKRADPELYEYLEEGYAERIRRLWRREG